MPPPPLSFVKEGQTYFKGGGMPSPPLNFIKEGQTNFEGRAISLIILKFVFKRLTDISITN